MLLKMEKEQAVSYFHNDLRVFTFPYRIECLAA